MWAKELSAALHAGRAASELILAHYSKLDARTSAPADVTTQTDHDSQEIILRTLADEFPEDAFRAEEATPTLAKLTSAGTRMWIIDPIDGTRGFVTKNGEFSVMIALVVEGEAVVGIVAEPACHRLTYAAREEGCWQTTASDPPRRVRVTSTAKLAESTLIQSHIKPGRDAPREVQLLKPGRVIETYSAGVKLARVADGTADLYVCDYAAMNDWDLAAGHVLVTEAGGQVSNLAGEPRIYGRESPKQFGGLLATNGRLQAAALVTLRSR